MRGVARLKSEAQMELDLITIGDPRTDGTRGS
jgi:hypothetical protein